MWLKREETIMALQNLIIDVHHLSKSFAGKAAVNDVSLQVKRGDIYGFLGPNGSGKTTVIRMLCGLLTPDSGTGTCLEYDIRTDTKFIKQHIGYIPQFFGLYKQLTIYENLLFVAELYGVIDRKIKVEIIMNQLSLTSRRDQLSGTLSGGWKQRLSLAAALIHEPLLLILDEPTASVDPKSRRDFWELMHSLASEGMTILLSSHNMDEVERCNEIAYICNGDILLNGKIKNIVQSVKLTTWRVKGKNLPLLVKQLQATPGVAQVITFFDTIHVTSDNSVLLEQAIKPYRQNKRFEWEQAESELEDVFIWLSNKFLSKSEDNIIE